MVLDLGSLLAGCGGWGASTGSLKEVGMTFSTWRARVGSMEAVELVGSRDLAVFVLPKEGNEGLRRKREDGAEGGSAGVVALTEDLATVGLAAGLSWLWKLAETDLVFLAAMDASEAASEAEGP